ncbi:MAG: membrane protein insertase YidC [Chlamydiota bacterium]
MDRRSLLFVILLTVSLFFVNQWIFPPKKASTSQTPIVKKQEVLESTSTDFSSFHSPVVQGTQGEQFYIIENDYQQIVFSNMGGAIAQINLAFQDNDHPNSPVLPIGFDRTLMEKSPANATFPGLPYFVNDGTGIKSVTSETVGNYYPLLRRTLFTPKGAVVNAAPSSLYALNVVDSSAGKPAEFTVKRLEKNLIEFERVDNQRRINKIFRFANDPKEAPYCMDVSIRIDGDAKDLWLTTGVPEVEIISDNPAPSLKYRMQKSNGKKTIEQLSLPKDTTSISGIYPDWICNSNGFFGLILDPLSEIAPGLKARLIPGQVDPTRLTLIDPQYQPFPADKYPGYEMLLPLRAKPMEFRLYAGPFEDDLLKLIDATYSDPAVGYNPGYIGAMSFHGWFTFISEPFAKFLFILMKFFYKISTSWGISIILLTVALRIMLFPLNSWSIKSTVKMQQIAPKVAAIQEKYKKDPKRGQIEIMGLYREKGVNPLSGCFPLLIQLPFLIGMFDLLKSTFELRGVPFIPGWIDNLTAPDVLFSWNYPVIFFGDSFHFLPVLLGLVMWAQQRFSASAPKDPKLMTDQQKQQRTMGNIMTLVFTVMFYHFPSGLNIYWLSSMSLGILQQWFMVRKGLKK